MNPELQWTCNELISASVGGGAQGLLIIAFIWMLLKCCPRANAATRHAAWFATFLIVALLPAALFVGTLLEKAKNSAEPAVLPRVSPEAPNAYVETHQNESLAANEESAKAVELRVEPSSEPIPFALPTAGHPFAWGVTVPKRISATLILCWLVLAAIRLACLARQLWLLRFIKARANSAPEILAEPFSRIVVSMGMTRKPRLLISDEAAAPMVIGFFRPAMLLPKFIAAQSNTSQMEHLFRHELAHLARRDDWTNLAQQAIAAILFYHPGILFLSRRLAAEREIACDDHALAISRTPREYALYLTEFASRMKGRDFTAAPAAWSSNSQLKERIGMILDIKRNASPRVSRASVGGITLATLALALCSIAAAPRFVVAAAEPAIEAVVESVSVEPSEISVEAEVESTVELALAIEAVEAVEPIIAVEPPHVSIASVTTPPREKGPMPMPQINLNFNHPQPAQAARVAPAPRASVRVAAAPAPEAAPDPDGRPRPKPTPRHESRDDGDLERRLERLERKVDELLKHEKGGAFTKDGMIFNGKVLEDMRGKKQAEMERFNREMERAQREVEHSARDQKLAMEGRANEERNRAGQMAERQSLKARRQALEAHRKQIDKELEALEKEMQKEDQGRDKKPDKEKDKHNKSDDKPEKKNRDTGDNSDSDEDSKPAK